MALSGGKLYKFDVVNEFSTLVITFLWVVVLTFMANIFLLPLGHKL